MLFSSWSRRPARSSRTYQPEVCLLEDRVVPTLLRPTPLPAAPLATHLVVIVPPNVEAGTPINVVVEAEDAHNKVVPGFRGTVHVGLGTADPGATIPAAFTFSASDHGIHTIQVTLQATGPQTITTSSGALAGSASLDVNAPVTHFSVTTFGSATAGTGTLVNVVALDANNHVVPGYTGTIHFTTTGFFAYPVPDYAFTAGDAGSHLFSATFAYAGSQTLAVNDVARGSITGGAVIKVLAAWTSPGYYGSYYSPSYSYYGAYGNRASYSYYGPWGWSFY